MCVWLYLQTPGGGKVNAHRAVCGINKRSPDKKKKKGELSKKRSEIFQNDKKTDRSKRGDGQSRRAWKRTWLVLTDPKPLEVTAGPKTKKAERKKKRKTLPIAALRPRA